MFFFFKATATPEIYALPLHDALPIFRERILTAQLRSCAGTDGGKRSRECLGPRNCVLPVLSSDAGLPCETTRLRDADTASIGVDSAAHDGSTGKYPLFVANSARADISDYDGGDADGG